jgi:hypothetical protein
MEKMPGHTRLYRRGAVYYHRAGIPTDIKDTYRKTEETFSLKTKDYREALRLVKIAAVEVDQRFEAHRQRIKRREAGLPDLSEEQIKALADDWLRTELNEAQESRVANQSPIPKWPVAMVYGSDDDCMSSEPLGHMSWFSNRHFP